MNPNMASIIWIIDTHVQEFFRLRNSIYGLESTEMLVQLTGAMDIFSKLQKIWHLHF